MWQLLIFLTLYLTVPNVILVEGSFMQWSRVLNASIDSNVNIASSVAGINVINYVTFNMTGSSQPMTDIVDADTGVLLLQIKQALSYDISIVITPAEDSYGLFTCRPWYTSEGEGSVATQETWCGVLQMRQYGPEAQIILPNSTVVQLSGGPTSKLAVPWNCSEKWPCVVRSQELQDGQVGGCYRRKNSTAAYQGWRPVTPPQSTHVSVAWNGTLYMFRPLELAASDNNPTFALALITQKAIPQWSLGVDDVVQYLPIAFAADQAAAIQGAGCLLTLLYKNGTVFMYDSDHDASSTSAELVLFTQLGMGGTLCLPSIESTKRLLQCADQSLTVPAAVYQTVFAVTCACRGEGYLFDLQYLEGHYPASTNAVGLYEVPQGIVAYPRLHTDTSILLVQPYVNYTYPDGNSSSSIGSFYAYVTAIALSTVPIGTPSAPNSGAIVVTIIYSTTVLNMESAVLLSKSLISQQTIQNFSTSIYEGAVQNITNTLGWVALSEIPIAVTVTTSLPVLNLVAAQGTARLLDWIEGSGIAYAVLANDVFILINTTDGTALTFNETSPPSGEGLVAPMVRVHNYSSARYSSPTKVWGYAPHRPSMGLNTSQGLLSSSSILQTSQPLAPNEQAKNKVACAYSLTSHSGILLSSFEIHQLVVLSNIIEWSINVTSSPLLSPYSQSYCPTVPDTASVSVYPSSSSLLFAQTSMTADPTTAHVRVSSNPIQGVIASTLAVNYALGVPINDTSASVSAASPSASDLTFVCAYDTAIAYSGVLENIVWSYELSNAEPIICLGDDSLPPTLSADGAYVFFHVSYISQTQNYKNTKGILMLTTDGALVQYLDPISGADLGPNTPACVQANNVSDSYGPLVDVTNYLVPGAQGSYQFVGVVVWPNTRCFAVIAMDGTGWLTWTLTYMSGEWAALSPTIVAFEGLIILSDAHSKSTISFGSTCYCYTIASVLSALQTIPSYGVPLFGYFLSIVGLAPLGSLLFLTHVDVDTYTVYVELRAYDLNLNLLSSTVVATYLPYDPDLSTQLGMIGLFSLPRSRISKVCVTTGNITCYDASSRLNNPISFSSTTTEYYGVPTVSYQSVMLFTIAGSPCSAVRYAAADEGPIELWSELTWTGIESGIDMNINSSSCTASVISNEGAIIQCGSIDSPEVGSAYLIEVTTGRVLLANGPSSMLGVAFSTSGSQLWFINSLGTLTVLNLVGTMPELPVTIYSDFCMADSIFTNANYHLEFHQEYITSTVTPWNVSMPQVQVNVTGVNTTYLPLKAAQFIGFLGVRLGSMFSLKGSDELISILAEVLPPVVIAQPRLTFVLDGQSIVLVDDTNGSPISRSGTCQLCETTSCSQFCGVELASGDQYQYRMQPESNSYQVLFKGNGNETFVNSTYLLEPFIGNSTLVGARIEASLDSQMQMFSCAQYLSDTTNLATDTRYCMAVLEVNVRRFVAVEVAGNGLFAIVTTYSTLWSGEFFAYQQAVQYTPVWMVGNIPSIANMITQAIGTGAFPNSFPSGAPLSSVGAITIDPNSQIMTIAPPSGSSSFNLSPGQCTAMDSEIPLCSNTLPVYNSSDALKRKSVVWSGIPGSNWGKGFVATNFEFQLPSIMRFTQKGKPVQCGGEGVSIACPSACQGTGNCNSQIISFLNHYLYTASMLPERSTAFVPPAFLISCGLSLNISRSSQDFDSTVAMIRTKFYCTSKHDVVMTMAFSGQNVVMGYFSGNASLDNFAGVVPSCSDCTYFMLVGIISQPLGWIAAGAVKNLIVTVLFYFILDKARRNNRYQSQFKNLHKHNLRKLEAIELRLAAHRMYAKADLVEMRDTSAYSLPSEASADSSDVVDLSNRIALIGEGAALYSGYRSKPIESMSEEERRAERHQLKTEAIRVQEQVRDDQVFLAAKDSSRWFCARLLPNPIVLYSNLVIKLAGIKHPEERRAWLVRVQDGLSSKDVSAQQLADMLMSIISESPEERPAVEAFSHFYQWNMCLNRQVVVREYIEESSHFQSQVVVDLMVKSLEKTHERLRDAYVLFRIAFVDNRKGRRESRLTEARSNATSMVPPIGSEHHRVVTEREPLLSVDSKVRESKASSFRTAMFKSSLTTLVEREEVILQAIQQKLTEGLLPSEAPPTDVVPKDFGASFRGMDGVASVHQLSAEGALAEPPRVVSDQSSMVTTDNNQAERVSAVLPSLTIDTLQEHSTKIETKSKQIESARIQQSATELLKKEVDGFDTLIQLFPQCFEYVSLPSRSIDDKLMPNTLLIIVSICECMLVMVIYAVEVIGRDQDEGLLSGFDTYQCVYFLVFNSSTPAALIVSVASRADLGSLEHYQSWRSKLRDIASDPYVVFVLLMYSLPFTTHVMPGLILYGWATIPILVICISLEYWVRTRLSLQTSFAIAARLLSRLLILFAVAVVMTVSFNYSAAYLWSTPEGYQMSGMYRKASYLEVPYNDFIARDWACFYQHITSSLTNFLQIGVTSLY